MTTSNDEVTRLRELAAACYAGLGTECKLPEPWLDALSSAAGGKAFTTDGLLPFFEAKADAVLDDALYYAPAIAKKPMPVAYPRRVASHIYEYSPDVLVVFDPVDGGSSILGAARTLDEAITIRDRKD